MAEASHISLRFDLTRLPFVAGARKYAEKGLYCSGTARNEAYFGPHVRISPHLDARITRLLFGSETSGGLIAVVAPKALPALETALWEAGQACWVVGDVATGEGIEVR